MSLPFVSILFPVYNAVNDLPRAMRSLLNQTWTDFEILAIDDGSTDGSAELLDRFAQADPRIRVFHQENAGALGKVLNRAAELAQGQFLARQDADDASAPTRLENRVRYLEKRPGIGLCGTWTWFIDTELGPLFSLELPDNHAVLCHYLNHGRNPLVHGSVMVRAEIFKQSGGYRGSYAEDYDLWLRISEKTRLGICSSLGYYYWRSVGGISIGAELRQQALIKLILKLGAERRQWGREISDWEREYQKIANLPLAESSPIERQTSMCYARGLQLLRQGRFSPARREFEKAAQGQGPSARKARRNLSWFWLAPLLAGAYALQRRQEPERYARLLPHNAAIPEKLKN